MITQVHTISEQLANTISNTILQYENMLPVTAQEIIQKFRLNLFFIFYDDSSQEYSFYQIKNGHFQTAEMASVYGKGYLKFLINHFNKECSKMGIKTAIAITIKECIAKVFLHNSNGKKIEFWDLIAKKYKYAIIWDPSKKTNSYRSYQYNKS